MKLYINSDETRPAEIPSLNCQVTLVRNLDEIPKGERYLRCDERGLALVQDHMELLCNFRSMLSRVGRGHLQHEKLLRAVRMKEEVPEPFAVDATAGLGEDSFILAAAGFQVLLFEYNPVIAGLLRDGLERALKDPEIADIASRMELVEGDSVDLLAGLKRRPNLIYLDPMFPAKKKSGISTKKLQLFQKLEQPCENEEALMDAARAVHPDKIVVKRPIKGPPLAGKKPGYSIDCRNVRYDCYVFSKNRNT